MVNISKEVRGVIVMGDVLTTRYIYLVRAWVRAPAINRVYVSVFGKVFRQVGKQ